MSAAQRMGRLCPECGLAIEGRHPGTIRHPLCQLVHRNSLRNALRSRRAEMGIPEKHTPKPEFKSLRPRVNCVTRGGIADVPKAPQVLCKVCFGMPWARGEDRHDEHYNENGGLGVDGVVRCRGCREPYAPEPPPEPVSVLGSSAGMAARHGQLHGSSSSCSGMPTKAKFHGK